MSKRLRFYRRIRSTVLALRTKSNDRIVTDFTMLSPLISSKGTPVSSNGIGKRSGLKRSRTLQTKRSGKGTKTIKF